MTSVSCLVTEKDQGDREDTQHRQNLCISKYSHLLDLEMINYELNTGRYFNLVCLLIRR